MSRYKITSGLLSTPLKFLVLYIAFIPSFAFVYYNMTGEFYAPFAKLERPAIFQVDELSFAIRDQIRSQLQQMKKTPFYRSVYFDELYVNVGQFEMGENASFEFELAVGLRSSEKVGWAFLPTLKVRIEPKGWLIHLDREEVHGFRAHLLERHEIDETPEEIRTAAFDAIFKLPGLDVGLLRTPPQLERAYNRLIVGFKGDPTAFEDSYLRMLYFSATAIMTIGFGDIIPISNRARLLVMLEALCGLITLGFFLNGMASRLSGNRNTMGG